MEKIAKTPEDRRREKRNRAMMEDLPVLERVVITPEGVDEAFYKKIGEEVTRVVEHKPGQLYIKEIVREKWGLKDNQTTHIRLRGHILFHVRIIGIHNIIKWW